MVTTETGGWIRTEFENLTFDNLLSGTTYYFRVKAKSATAGVSDSDWNPAPDGFGFQVFETTAVGLAVLYQVLNEVFMVAGKSGYLPPPVAGLTPTVVFGAYGIYLLKKAG